MVFHSVLKLFSFQNHGSKPPRKQARNEKAKRACAVFPDQILQSATFSSSIIEVFNNPVKQKSGLSLLSPPLQSAKHPSSARVGVFQLSA
jgi:hypothetical protein